MVYRIFNFEMYSLMIKVAILVNRAVLDDIIIPAPGLINPNVEVLIADPDPINILVIINNILFLFEDLYFFLYESLSLLRYFNIFS